MLATETIVPIYFAMEDDELLSIYTQTLTSSTSQGSLSAAEGRRFFLCRLNVLCGGKIHSALVFGVSSFAAYGHSQWLSDGDQWSSEQSHQRLDNHQFRGEKPKEKAIFLST